MARYEADVELLLLFVSLVVKFRLPVNPGATLPLLLAVTVKQAVFCCGVTITVACMPRGPRELARPLGTPRPRRAGSALPAQPAEIEAIPGGTLGAVTVTVAL